MKRLFPIILALASLLLLAGCGQTGDGGTGGAAPRDPFLGGSQGLEIEFLEGQPPEEVTDGGAFDFTTVVALSNWGEYDLKKEEVRIDLVGFLPEDFGSTLDEVSDKIPEDDPTPRVRDSEGNIIEPVQTFTTFPSDSSFFNFNREVAGNTQYIFRADVCYKYQTEAVSQICVLRDLINTDDDTVCDPQASKTIFSSASPVQAVNFRQTVTGQNKISFSFDVVHSGRGEIFKEGDADSPPADCPQDPREKQRSENRVLVTVDTGLADLRCVGLAGQTSGYVQLADGKRTVTCTQELDPNRNDFEKNVDITLDFNYEDDIETDVLVKHLLS